MFNYKRITFFIVFCLVNELLICVNGVEKDKIKNVERYDVFQPNSEWQPLRKDQAVPPGLHIRINLATGEREAKLFDANEGDPGAESKRLALVSVDQENNSINGNYAWETAKLLPNDSMTEGNLRNVLPKNIVRINKKLKNGSEEYKKLKTGAERKAVVPEIRLISSGNIVVGSGYSSDSQQVVPQICYNVTISSTSKEQGFMQLDSALSYSELENILGISVSVSGMYEMFSVGAEVDYIRSIQDKDYSMSLNYLQYSVNNLALQIGGDGEDALTELGKSFYKSGKNPYFGLICGDNYISSYQQGALLIMGLNIKFGSAIAKKEFIEKAGVSFGNIISASESVYTAASKNKIAGIVIIQAFQIGGNPSRLSQVLKKDSSGNYYALTCSLTAIDNCINAASGLLDYAKDDFSTQITFKDKYTPLGVSFSQFTPIDHIGLIPPVSLVTEEVQQYRDELSNKLKENEYYKEKVYPFYNQGYPIELDTIFMMNMNSLLSKANSNVNLIRQAHKGAVDCFNLPDKCKAIKSRIDSQLQNITNNDLKFLENIKYRITTLGGFFYNIGQGLDTSWRGVTHESGGYILARVRNVSVTNTEYLYHIDINKSGIPRSLYEYKYHGTSTDGLTYIGSLCYYPNTCRPLIETKLLSPFYFEAYSNSIADKLEVKLVS